VDILGPIKRHKTLTEQAADAIRARIINGEFQFGEALSEITLATELGVSKTPVREAFLQLKNEGLVEIQPQRGTFVFQMSSEQLRQLTDMRELLEATALRFAPRNGGGGLPRVVTSIIDRMSEAVAVKHHVAYRRLDAEFHQAIITASGNEFLDSAYHVIAVRIQALRNRLSQDSHNWRSFDEHLEVARLIQNHEFEAAAAQLVDHIRGAFVEYLERVEGNLTRARAV
jgi:DNA-binding GntR family transcriptional regulator